MVKIICKKKVFEDFFLKFLFCEIKVFKRFCYFYVILFIEVIEINIRMYIIIDLVESGDFLEYIRKYGVVLEVIVK